MSEWRECSQELPGPGRRVLTATRLGEVHFAFLHTTKQDMGAFVMWQCVDSVCRTAFDYVTHWMPLPPPPGSASNEPRSE